MIRLTAVLLGSSFRASSFFYVNVEPKGLKVVVPKESKKYNFILLF